MAYEVKTSSSNREWGKSKKILLQTDVCHQWDLLVSVNGVFKTIDDVILWDVYTGVIGKVEEDSTTASKSPVLVTLYDDTMTVWVKITNTETWEITEWEVQGAVLETIVEETVEIIEEDKSCLYEFQNYDGTILQSWKIVKGTTPEYTGETPTKEWTVAIEYVFNGWSPTLWPTYEDTVYVAQFTEQAVQYTVTWENWDESTLAQELYDYWSNPVYKGDTPERQETEQASYEFSGWSPELSEVTENVTYVAQYVEHVKASSITIELTPLYYPTGWEPLTDPYLTITSATGIHSALQWKVYVLDDGGKQAGAQSLWFLSLWGSEKETITFTDSTSMTADFVASHKLYDDNWPYYSYNDWITSVDPSTGLDYYNSFIYAWYDALNDSMGLTTMYLWKYLWWDYFLTDNTLNYQQLYNIVYTSGTTEHDNLATIASKQVLTANDYNYLQQLTVWHQYYSKQYASNDWTYDWYDCSITENTYFWIPVIMNFQFKVNPQNTSEWYICYMGNTQFDYTSVDSTELSIGSKVSQSYTGWYDYFDNSELDRIHLFYISTTTYSWGTISHDTMLWELTVSDGTNSITIADRNYWATTYMSQSWTFEDYAWAVFQWWNGYAFSSNPSDTITTLSGTIDTQSLEASTYFSDSFCIWSSDWSNPANDNLWWDTDNTEYARRWPCNTWYHIPTGREWSSLISLWKSVTGYTDVDLTEMRETLLLPSTGYRDYTDGSVTDQWTKCCYWASSVSGSYAEIFRISSTNWSYTSDSRWKWCSIRPFKNTQ